MSSRTLETCGVIATLQSIESTSFVFQVDPENV